MNRLGMCMDAIKARFSGERKENENLRFVFPFDYEEYVQLLIQSANSILEKRREKTTFVIDHLNEHIIQQLYIYLTLDNQFFGELQKGIMLMGKYGSGKTIIMQSMAEMYNTVIPTLYIRHPMIKFFKSSDLQNILTGKPNNGYTRMPLIIDEFGREPKQVMDFGNLRSPIIEILCERYDTGAWTHGTSNFTLDTLCSENQYGKMTGNRLKSILNFIELKGESRRK